VSAAVNPTAVEDVQPAVETRRGLLRRELLRQRQALVGLAILVAFVLTAVLSPLLLSQDPKTKVGDVFESPSGSHLLGTDGGGADMLDLLIGGASVSLIVGFAAAAVSALIGGTFGLLSGFFGGKTDILLMRITDYFLVIPDVPLMIVVAALFGRSLTNIILIIGAIYWTTTARLIRAQVKSVRERVYVKRARALGAGNLRLLGRHVLPQVAPLLIANTVLLVAYAIFAETFITFLGLGDPSLVSWGRLIENAFTDDAILNDAWWAIVPPGALVALIILGCSLVGGALEDALNPRLRVAHLSARTFRLRPLVGRGDAL
jgi:peptide/nickel transport system permease protein